MRKVRGWPLDKQREIIGPVAAEYAGSIPVNAVHSVRKGDELVVAVTRVLADNRDAISEAIQIVNDRGGTLLEMHTGRNSREHGAAIMADAIKDIANEKRAEGKRNGRKGSDVRWAKIKRMSQRKALLIWRNSQYSTAEAIAQMPGWTKTTAYRKLGQRDIPVGRR